VLLLPHLTAAQGRARDVASYEGWLATMRAFAVAFDDPHISLGTRLSLGTVRWPGFVVARRGDSTLVSSRDTTDSDAPGPGAVLVSCDGVTADQYGRTRLGVFRGTWDVASQRVRTTPFLLVDDGNPFLPPARACVVREGNREREIVPRWRNVSATALQERLREASPVGAAGFAVRRSGDGWWIGIQSLGGRVQEVLGYIRDMGPRLGEASVKPVASRARLDQGRWGIARWGRHRLQHAIHASARLPASIRIGDVRDVAEGRVRPADAPWPLRARDVVSRADGRHAGDRNVDRRCRYWAQ
jgi:hypothetical protein